MREHQKLILSIMVIMMAIVLVALPFSLSSGRFAARHDVYELVGPTERLHEMVLETRMPLDAIRGELQKKPMLASQYRWMGDSLLSLAASKDRENVAQLLLEFGADINGRDKGMPPTGSTPLFIAVLYKNQNMVRFLLGAGADPYAEGWAGTSAADICKDSSEIIQKMFEPYPPREKPPGDKPRLFIPPGLSESQP